MLLSVQLYSLREFMPFGEMLNFCKAKGFRYVEPAGFYENSTAEIVQKINAAGLKAPSFHFGLDVLQQNWQELGDELPKCGTSDLVMPFADADSLDEVKKLAEQLQGIGEKLTGKGIKLHYHNHAHEITKVFEGKCFMDQLLELAPDLGWQMDVGWITAGGADAADKMEQWKERIKMLHIKDILAKENNGPIAAKNINGVEVVISAAAQKGGQPARIGDGIVDFETIFSKAKELNISAFILENDNPADPDAFADSGIELVNKYMTQ